MKLYLYVCTCVPGVFLQRDGLCTAEPEVLSPWGERNFRWSISSFAIPCRAFYQTLAPMNCLYLRGRDAVTSTFYDPKFLKIHK